MPVSPDHNLAPEQFPDLNRAFYRAHPAGYLAQRARSLLIAVADAPAVRAALAGGVTYESIQYFADADEPFDREAADAYAAEESTNLLHHAAESMIRLYLAHAGRPPCPWLELARLRRPGDFKAKVETLRDSVDQPEVVEDLVRVFYGNPDPAALGFSIPQEEWDGKIRGLTALVRHLCTVLLDDAPLYNATKHGLAVVAGDHGLQLSSPASDLVISTDGLALEFLGQANDPESGRWKWTHELKFVRIEANLAMIEVVARQINALWRIARNRYVEPTTPVDLFPLDPDEIASLVNLGRPDAMTFNGMSQTLAYHLDEQADDDGEPA